METRQLALITDGEPRSRPWRLDEHTRQVGRDGIAAARRALQEALARQHREDHEPHAA